MVDPQPYMTYQPFLPEAAAGSRRAAARRGAAARDAAPAAGSSPAGSSGVDHAQQGRAVQPVEGPEYEVAYDMS